MSKVLAVISFIDQSGRPIDPGFGIGADRPDNSLPGGERPVDPGFGRPSFGPIDPGFGVGLPPVVDNGLPSVPGRPDNGLPTYPVTPGNDLPSRPGVWPKPPSVGVWPPRQPVFPELPIYPTDGPGVDNSLPLPPGSVWPPLPPTVSGKILAFAWLVGIGYRWIVIDPSLKPGFPLPTPPVRPGNELPDTPQPKR